MLHLPIWKSGFMKRPFLVVEIRAGNVRKILPNFGKGLPFVRI
jgi:hypothetical protein